MQNKISYKLIFLIFLISLVVTSISVYIQIKKQYENQLNSFEKSLNSIEKNQVPILSQSLWNIDDLAVNIFLKNLVNNEKVIYAEIIENDEKTISVGKIKKINIIKKEFEIEKVIDSKIHKIGELIVIADLAPMYKELKSNVISIIFTEIIKMLLISLSIIFFMKKLLTNPLEKMALYANQLSLENLHKPLKINNTTKAKFNELNILTESINTMRVNLIKQINQSEEKNNILAQQSKLAAMGEMIGNIAHQWRQPLSLITTTASGIKLNYEIGALDKEKVDNYTSKIINSAYYLSDTIDDFKDFFKPNKNKKYFKISNAFERTFTLLNSQFINNNISFIKNIEDIEIYGFENELIQVLINILNNAKDELINKKDQKLFIFIDVFFKDNNVCICIKDNAGGIEDSVINRIFEPYFTTKHQSQGTGIGLYMSEEIVSKHMKGKLSVQNVDFEYEHINYKGAEFKIVINKNEKKDQKLEDI
ncbi:ATP-binding protein [Arcobacter sp. LA11]|uniref:sensor histidine kinase n=1 Tax=Arcobacter sp. LA11 TaxID=1898176 RepID=UPI0009323960|nr:ATP-binding protein [Arcobacter sp. LA11]